MTIKKKISQTKVPCSCSTIQFIKKIPVLVHNGKPIAESLVILEYIEETWKHNPILPEDPYERAKERFWAKFVDDKCVPGIFGTFAKVGEEQQKIAKEARENLKILDGELGKKHFFGDPKIGFMDVASAWIICWGQIVEEIVDIKLIDAEEMPSLVSWFQNVLEAAPVQSLQDAVSISHIHCALHILSRRLRVSTK